MKHTYLYSILAFALVSVIMANTVHADTSAYGAYGGTPPAQTVLIDKMVSTVGTDSKGGASTSQYVDNLASSDYRYKPNQYVYFKLKVKNTSDSTLENVIVTDELPDYVDYVEASVDSEQEGNLVTIRVGTLTPDQEKTYYIAARVRAQNELPTDKGLFCLTNKSIVRADNANDDADTAQFCIEKQVLGVEKVPEAGPEMWALIGGAQIAALGLGVYLKKKS